MLVSLIEVVNLSRFSNTKRNYSLSEIFVNPKQVVCMREELNIKEKMILEGAYPKGLDKRQSFTKLSLQRGGSGIDIVVVGAPAAVMEKIHGKKGMLSG